MDETIVPGSAGRARAAALEVRRRAREFSETAAYGRSKRLSMSWTGPLSMASRRTIAAEEPKLAMLQADSLAIARSLEGHADWIDREVARLEAAEAKVRHWIEADPTNPAVLNALSSGLPPRHNTRWHRLAVGLGPGTSGMFR